MRPRSSRTRDPRGRLRQGVVSSAIVSPAPRADPSISPAGPTGNNAVANEIGGRSRRFSLVTIRLVRSRRLELPRVAPQRPQRCASTNSATTAERRAPCNKREPRLQYQVSAVGRRSPLPTSAGPYALFARSRTSRGDFGRFSPVRLMAKVSIDIAGGWRCTSAGCSPGRALPSIAHRLWRSESA